MELFKQLYEAKRGSQLAMDLEGRSYMPYLAIVTNNNDPEGKRRIKVSSPDSPTVESYWLRRIVPHRSCDPPLPNIGQTVIVYSIDGDPLNGWYQSVENLPNPPLSKGSHQNDYRDRIDGDRTLETGGDLTENTEGKRDERTENNHTISCGERLRLQVDSGAYIELTSSGYIIICNKDNHCITLGSGGGLTFDANIVRFTSASDVSINGKQILSIGSIDNDGDVSVSKGW